ncbi:ParM/StbA family protein [Heyndrickxia sporothermodurans]|uniref:ParM/StbA family protein n=1 Tax=Heyndrickxia sporothermodurans TaxID=46224 RepID=UPI002DB9BF24|nr:ParM/StbA family protein [Heyndrickxia sporothermodurans]MEB6550203.1 ParM/StbA family protein [Heyndrickxia sporothermodurans]
MTKHIEVLKVANDIGNSQTKQIINGTLLKQPSVVKKIMVTPNVSETTLKQSIENLFDELLVNITSGAIKRNGMYMIGKRANITSDQVANMNIKLGEKYKHDIPILMTLSMNAAYIIQKVFEETNEVPKHLYGQVTMTTAIPASEYTPEKAKELEDRFSDNKHVVIVYIGNTTCTVELAYTNVKVVQEGVPALFAILESDSDILEKYNKEYDKELKPKDFKNKKILHVDIGDGTTEYIYTVGLNPVNDACSGERRGVGHATEEARRMLKSELNGRVNLNRQQFIEAMRDPSHNLHDDTNRLMQEAKYSQSQMILEDIQEKFMTNTSNAAQVIAVYGGGSIQFEDELYQELIEFAEEVKIEILWIPEEYAVDLNVRGMDVLNTKILFK